MVKPAELREISCRFTLPEQFDFCAAPRSCHDDNCFSCIHHHHHHDVNGNQKHSNHFPYYRTRYCSQAPHHHRRIALQTFAATNVNKTLPCGSFHDFSEMRNTQQPAVATTPPIIRKRSAKSFQKFSHLRRLPLFSTIFDALFIFFSCFAAFLLTLNSLSHLPKFSHNYMVFALAQQQNGQSYLPSYYPHYEHSNKVQPLQYSTTNNNHYHHHRPHRHHEPPRASESNAMIELNFGDGDFSLSPPKNAAAATVAVQPKSLENNSNGKPEQQPHHQPHLITYSELDYDMIPSSLAAAKPHPTINVKRDAQQYQQPAQSQNDNFRLLRPDQNYYNASTFSDFNSDFLAPPSYPIDPQQPPSALDRNPWSQTYYFTPSAEPPTTSTLSYSTVFEQQQSHQPAQLLYRHNNNRHVTLHSNVNSANSPQFTPRARSNNPDNFAPPPIHPTVPDIYLINHGSDGQDFTGQINEKQQHEAVNRIVYNDRLSPTVESSTHVMKRPQSPVVDGQQRTVNNPNKHTQHQISSHQQRRLRPAPSPPLQRPQSTAYDDAVVLDHNSVQKPSYPQQPISPSQSFPPPLTNDNNNNPEIEPPFFGPPISFQPKPSATKPTAELPLTCPVNSTQYLPTIVDACSVSSRGLHPPGRMVSAAEAARMVTHETNITCDGGISVASLKWVFACIAAVPRHRVRLAIVGMRDAFVTFDSILPHGVAAEPSDYRNVKELRLENLYGLILPARLLDFFPNLEKFVLRGTDLGQSLPSSAFLQQPPPLDGNVNNKIHPLVELAIEHCKVEKLESDSLLFLDHLRKVTISNNNLVDLPFAALERMQNLQELDLSNNQLSLPPYQRVERLPPELRQLNLSGNLFADFPYRVVRQSGGKIQWLDVSRNRITFLKAKQLREDDRTQIIGKTRYLTHIDMSKNQVNLIGYPFTALFPAMTHFNMSSNSVPFVGPLLFSDQSQTLLNLDLSFNRISYIYQGLENLTNLQTLNLSTNRIDRMVSGSLAGARESLRNVHLDNNHLTRLPSAISELNNLERLDLSRNRMVKFEPAELTNSDSTLEMLALPRSIEIRNVPQFDKFERLRLLDIPNANLVCNENFLCRMIYELQGEHPAYCYVPPEHVLHNRTNKGWMRVGDFVNNSTFPCPSRDKLLGISDGSGDGTDGADGRASANAMMITFAVIVILAANASTATLLCGGNNIFWWDGAAETLRKYNRRPATAQRVCKSRRKNCFPGNSHTNTNEIFTATNHRRQNRQKYNFCFSFDQPKQLYSTLSFLRVVVNRY